MCSVFPGCYRYVWGHWCDAPAEDGIHGCRGQGLCTKAGKSFRSTDEIEPLKCCCCRLIWKGSSVRVFVHNHFVGWPDMGVADQNQLLNLIRLYRSSDTYTRAWPLLVHCSAGVGRTGTFLLTDAIFDQASNGKTVDFLRQLWLIRNQRISLVEKPEQYALAHRVILQAYKEGLFDPNKTPRPFNPEQINGSPPGLFHSNALFTVVLSLCLYITCS